MGELKAGVVTAPSQAAMKEFEEKRVQYDQEAGKEPSETREPKIRVGMPGMGMNLFGGGNPRDFVKRRKSLGGASHARTQTEPMASTSPLGPLKNKAAATEAGVDNKIPGSQKLPVGFLLKNLEKTDDDYKPSTLPEGFQLTTHDNEKKGKVTKERAEKAEEAIKKDKDDNDVKENDGKASKAKHENEQQEVGAKSIGKVNEQAKTVAEDEDKLEAPSTFLAKRMALFKEREVGDRVGAASPADPKAVAEGDLKPTRAKSNSLAERMKMFDKT